MSESQQHVCLRGINYRLSSLLQRQQHSQLNQTWAHARCTLLRLVQTAATLAVFATPPTPKTDAFFATDSALGAVTPGGLYKHQNKALIHLRIV